MLVSVDNTSDNSLSLFQSQDVQQETSLREDSDEENVSFIKLETFL